MVRDTMNHQSEEIAQHLRNLYFGGNWTAVSFKPHLDEVDLKTALSPVKNLNTIATLVYHCNYYVEAITRVLKKRPIAAKDAESFDHPEFKTETEWENFKKETFINVEHLANLIEGLSDDILSKTFVDDKYGNYYRNFCGLIEHSHYHLGQIVIIKKLLKK